MINKIQGTNAEDKHPGEGLPAGKKKILVVDDDVQIRQALRKVLRAEGYEVVLAADGREGLEKFSAGGLDLMLLDISLPDMSGWDVFGAATAVNPFVPIIIITGKNQQFELTALSGAGALIEKPLDVPKLLQIVAEILAETSETHLKRLVGMHRHMHRVRAVRHGLEQHGSLLPENKA